jgi:hypothetical protein
MKVRVSANLCTFRLFDLLVLRYFVPQKPQFMRCFGSLQGKNRPIDDFWDFMHEAQQTVRG